MTGSILVVEDDATLARSIERNLSVRGYRTRSAGTVARALEALDRECPALLLLDIDLPDGSGWEVLRKVRAGTCADSTVIVMSALRPNPRLARELRCVAVLEKPFPIESLLRLVAESLDHTDGEASREAHLPDAHVPRSTTHD